jgi:hypothetical protein
MLLYCSAGETLELRVPIDCGNGRWNCGVSLARLLWGVPPSCIVSLLAAMLLERRIVLVSSQRDTVTAAVQAAAALLYPFRYAVCTRSMKGHTSTLPVVNTIILV